MDNATKEWQEKMSRYSSDVHCGVEHASDWNHGRPYIDTGYPSPTQLSAIHRGLSVGGGVRHLHIYGPPGYGKTRLAHEISLTAPWADEVVWLRSTGGDISDLLMMAYEANALGASAVMVRDCIPSDVDMPSLRYAVTSHPDGKVRLLTAGDYPMPTDGTSEQLWTTPADDDVIAAIIRSHGYNLPGDLMSAAVEGTAGNIILAIRLADEYTETSKISDKVREMRKGFTAGGFSAGGFSAGVAK